jgi:general L-amino acid transport system permease protein
MSDIQAQTDLFFVRQELAPVLPPPHAATGPIGWVRRNLFASVGDTILTILAMLFIAFALPPLLNWAFFDAVWSGTNRDVCISPDAGACWAFVKAKYAQFIYGRYPLAERWRVDLVFLLLAGGLIPFAIPRAPYKGWNAIFLFAVFPLIALILLTGGDLPIAPGLVALVPMLGCFVGGFLVLRRPGSPTPARRVLTIVLPLGILAYLASFVVAGPDIEIFGLRMGAVWLVAALCALASLVAALAIALGDRGGMGALVAVGVTVLGLLLLLAVLATDFGLSRVETPLWGGLLVTLVVSYVGMVAALPLGILLALGRRSQLPIVRTLCVVFIEFWRGVPLITVLFMASVMLPLFLPPGVNFDKLLRTLIGVALFSAAYMAEVVRGGLQAIPKGQYEAANALGLGYWKTTRLVTMPQALKLVIPGIVNTFIGLFKDTSLVYIIGLFDLLGIVRLNFTDTNWASWQTPATGLVFAAFIFWMFCFSMSRYSQYMERRLNTGHKH